MSNAIFRTLLNSNFIVGSAVYSTNEYF